MLHAWPTCREDPGARPFDIRIFTKHVSVLVEVDGLQSCLGLARSLENLLECNGSRSLRVEFHWSLWRTVDPEMKEVSENLGRQLCGGLRVEVEGTTKGLGWRNTRSNGVREVLG